MGSERAMVVHGEDGLDEISISSPTIVVGEDGSAVTLSTYTRSCTDCVDGR